MALDPSQPGAQNDVPPQSADALSNETHQDSEVSGNTVESLNATAYQWVGKQLGKYRVIDVIGAGGMGFVLRAHDPSIERDVAIKMLADHSAMNPTALNRFRAEAKAAGRLSHANVAAIYEIGQEGASNYLAMELLSGGSVADELRQKGPFSPLEATRIMIDACQGIAAAHAAKLIHRDIKPANLVRAADRVVKVTDFGLAKLTVGDTSAATPMTHPGTVLGTPYYMSPEQCQGQEVDARSDIYSLGATYFSLMTGQQPYQECGSVVEVLVAHCRNEIPDPRQINPDVPRACSSIVTHAMAKSPTDRYQSVGEMLADLRSVEAALSSEVHIDLPSQSGSRAAVVPGKPKGPNSSRRWLLASGLGVAIVLLVAAIRGRSLWNRPPSGLPDPQARQPAPPVLSDDPIKVGVLQSLSGTMSVSGTSVIDATLLAIDEINESGGLLGRPVTAIVADGRSDEQVFALEAERLITQEHVCTVFGCWTSAGRKAARTVFEDHDHLLVYPVQYEGMEASPNIIYLGAAPNQQIIPAVQWAIESLGKKRFFLVGSDYVFPRAAGEVVKDELQNSDAEIVGELFVPLGSTELEPVVQAILKSKPDMILNALVGNSNIVFFDELRDAGIPPTDLPCLSFSVGEQELRSVDIADVVGDYAAQTYFQSLETDANRAFVQRFTAKYPQRVISDPMEAAYVGVLLWAQAVRDAESIEPKEIRRAMLNQRLVAPEGEIRIDPDTQHCFKTPRVGQIQENGQFRIVWSAKEPIRPDPYPASRTAEDWKAFLHDLYAGWGNQWTSPVTD